MTAPPAILPGLILPDGSLQIAVPIGLPPGPVRVQVESLAQGCAEFHPIPVEVVERKPGPIFLDECISAPYDLPRPPGRVIGPLPVVELVPELHDFDGIVE